MAIKFSCISECSDCCLYREYYPSIKYGKIGVLILPDEKLKIEEYANTLGLKVTILPRLGIGVNQRGNGPQTIIAYQLMGKNADGNVCPFLELENTQKSPHGGLCCKIYDKKPVACTAYPVNKENGLTVTLDRNCRFCKDKGNENIRRDTKAYKSDLVREVQALRGIQRSTYVDNLTQVWRFATGIAEKDKLQRLYPRGWILQHDL